MSTVRQRSRRRAASAEGEEHGGGMERWLLTYADMITLLLALFVVLFALSTINARKFAAFRAGLLPSVDHAAALTAGGQGLLQQPALVSPLHARSAIPAAAAGVPAPTDLAALQARLEQALTRQGLQHDVAIRLETRGLVVQMLADRLFYAVDSAGLGPVGAQVVDTMAQVLAAEPNQIVVEGYTDSQPITGGPYPSNWALSAMRAVNVVSHFVQIDHLAEGRLAATGYGKTRPVAPNTTAAGMAANRRVDVVVLAPGQDRP